MTRIFPSPGKRASAGGATNPFVDSAALGRYVERMSTRIEKEWRKQK
ncbi:MAG: hypothetical protein ACRD2J_00350 [Thermoanaerobaculia bacterium]